MRCLLVATAIVIIFPHFIDAQKKPKKTTQQGKPAAQTTEPSLAETLDWLKEKITAYAFYNREIGDAAEKNFSSYKVESISFDGCTVSIKSVYRSSFLTNPTITTTTFENKVALSDLDPLRVTIEHKNNSSEYHLLIMTLKDELKVQSRMIQVRGLETSNSDESLNQLAITFSDKEMAQRAAKAFSHAIKLCGRKREPF